MSGIKRTTADAMFSDAVRLAAGNTCERCKRVGRMECAHLFGRRIAVLRWDTLNALCLCHTCHREFTENPKTFTDWVDSKFPSLWEMLHEKRQGFLKNNEATRKEVAAHYRQQIKKLESDPTHRLESWI